MQQIHAKFGISTPRNSTSLRYGGKAVAVSDMMPGDVVCYEGHVAIYIGGGQMIHAATEGVGVIVGPVQGGMIYVRY